jgi:malate dehydrogenase (oxaloacetate-decarboxylating)
MEAKAVLFKELGGVNAVPIVLETTDPKEIIKTVINIAPSFGGINLEDIAAPACFEVEQFLEKKLEIPVFHDDQWGTAIVVLAGLLNALKVVRKKFEKAKVVIVGAGAAGTATANLLLAQGFKEIIVFDSKGALWKGRKDLNSYKKELTSKTNPHNFSGDYKEALSGADVFIGLSKAGLLKRQDISRMNSRAIVFAMANPIPEIMPQEALKGGAEIVATGRSDFPNQINNALVFPGIFKGALEKRITKIDLKLKIKAALRLSELVSSPNKNKIIPRVGDKKAVIAIAGCF